MHDADSYLAGWRIRSNFPIAGLAPWTADERPPDVVILSGQIRHPPSCLVQKGPLLQISGDGSCWLTTPAATFFVNSDGTEVTVSSGDPSAGAVRAFLLSAIFAILCHKRRLLPIHASCLEIGGCAVALAGPSAAGKSILAAAFMKAGCSVLADDVTAVDAEAPGGPVVWPSFPRLRLWRDSLDALGLDSNSYLRCRPEIEKYEVPFPTAFPTGPVRLTALYHLRRDRKVESCSIQRLDGGRSLRDAAAAISHADAAGMLNDPNRGFRPVITLCAAAPAYSLVYRPGFDELPGTVAALRAKHAERP
jgi:hypothetical protein